MKTMTVGKLKAAFSDVLKAVGEGEEVAIAYGRNHRPVAMIVPYRKEQKQRRLGVLEGRATYRWQDDGKISDEEFLSS